MSQICINQETIAERNHQVQMMSQIYGNARGIIAWLTPPVDTIDPKCGKLCLPYLHCKMEDKRHKHVVDGKICQWLKAFVTNPYWDRLWIVQELLLAWEVSFWYRSDTLGWPDLEECRVLSASSQLIFIIRAKARKFTHQYEALSFDLAFVLKSFAGSKCRDPRDKVYGIMAMVEENQRLDVDYNKSEAQLMVDCVVILFSSRLRSEPVHAESSYDSGVQRAVERLARALGIPSPYQPYHSELYDSAYIMTLALRTKYGESISLQLKRLLHRGLVQEGLCATLHGLCNQWIQDGKSRITREEWVTACEQSRLSQEGVQREVRKYETWRSESYVYSGGL